MFVFVWFLTLCILGESEGENCMFPCNWINRDFTWKAGDTVLGFWNFSETTFIRQHGSDTMNIECVQIVGRFIIARITDTPTAVCYPIENNNADSFTTSGEYLSFGLDLTNLCSACSRPSNNLMTFSAVGTVAQDQTGPECNIPVGCPPDSPHAIICDDNGNIDYDCNDATTPPSPTTYPPPATPPPPPPPKNCKHGKP